MDYRSYIKKIAIGIADLVFPVYCLVCGKDAALQIAGRASTIEDGQGQFLCEECTLKLERLPNQICPVCQKPAPFGKTHPQCASKFKLNGVISALAYGNPKISQLIETFKYKFIKDLSPAFSKFIIEAINNQGLNGYFSEFTIIPVPLHKRRLAWRGFNQAQLLAAQLALDLGIKMDEELVVRNRFTKPQTTLTKEKRLANIERAFETSRSANGKFLLVDDVITTGATLNEIAKILKKSGASEVWAATVAHG